MSLFGAAWTLGSLAALSIAGATSTTFYETTGWRGLMETEAGSPLPQRFPSRPAEVYPLFHVFAAIAGFDRVAPVPSDPRLAGLAFFNAAGRRRLLLANLTDAPLEIRLVGCSPASRLGLLEATSLTPVSGLAGPPPPPGPDLGATLSGGVTVTLKAYGLAGIE